MKTMRVNDPTRDVLVVQVKNVSTAIGYIHYPSHSLKEAKQVQRPDVRSQHIKDAAKRL
jgi:hypothetical protein